MSKIFEVTDSLETCIDRLFCGLGILESVEHSMPSNLIREYPYERRALFSAIEYLNAEIESLAMLADELKKFDKEYRLIDKNA